MDVISLRQLSQGDDRYQVANRLNITLMANVVDLSACFESKHED